MKRTQLYLDEEMARTLSAESRRRKTTMSELVREAVAKTYGRPITDRTAAIRRVAGIWRDRDDLGDTESVVRELRRSTRAQRWKKGGRASVPSR